MDISYLFMVALVVVSGTMSIPASADGERRLVAVAGSSTTFVCETSSPDSRWTFMSNNSTAHRTICKVNNVTQCFAWRYSVRYNASHQTLVLHNVSAGDAGLYSCMDGAVGDTRHRFQLFVIRQSLECQTNLPKSGNVEEWDSIEVDCAFDAVNGTKAILFCGDGTETQTTGDTSTDGSRWVYRKVFVASRRFIDSRLSCTVELLSEDDGDTLYNEKWMSSIIHVIYGPVNTAIRSETQNIVAHGVILTCSAEGNPSPSYHWTYSGMTTDGQNIRFDVCQLDRTVSNNSTLSQTQHVEITCVSKSGNRTDTANLTAVAIIPTNFKDICHNNGESSRVAAAIGWSAGALILITLLVAVGVRCVGRRRHSRTKTNRESQEAVTYDDNTDLYIHRGSYEVPVVRPLYNLADMKGETYLQNEDSNTSDEHLYMNKASVTPGGHRYPKLSNDLPSAIYTAVNRATKGSD